jgi:hypothetical protein
MSTASDVHQWKPIARRALVLGLVMASSTLGFAQWLHYPTAGVPRKADGKPDLTAPAPRLPDGRPDLSGIWHVANRIPCTSEINRFVPCGLNIGTGLHGGLPFQPWSAALTKQRTADNSKDDPHARCLPDNPPRTWGLPHLTKIVHTPKLLVMLYEVNAMYRQIFLDGRPMPEDPTPAWNGYSVGTWDGDALVVQTTGFRDNLWIDMGGSPMSDAAKMTERLRRPNYGTLEVQITVDDPKVYTRPWTVALNQGLELDTELIDEFCLENEKSSQRMQAVRPPN